MEFLETTEKGLGYKAPRGKEIYKPKFVDEMKITYKPLHKQFEYGHTHGIKYTSYSEDFYVKPGFKHNLRTSNQKGPRRIWVPKEKIIYVADILKGDVETPTLALGLWMLATMMERRFMFQSLELKLGSNQKE